MKTSKRMIKLVSAAICVAMFSAALPSSAQEMPEVEVYAEAVSKYVWRGMVLTDDPVVQPGVTLSMYGFSFDIWANMDLTDVNRPGKRYRVSEIDYTLSYGIEPTAGLGLEFGAILYTFPGTGDASTTELYAEVGLELPLSPTLTVYRDIDEVKGWYASLEISHDFELSERLGMEIGAGIGWGDGKNNDGYFGVDKQSLTDMSVSAGLSYALAEGLEATAFVSYSDLLRGELRDAAGQSGELVGGVGLSYSF